MALLLPYALLILHDAGPAAHCMPTACVVVKCIGGFNVSPRGVSSRGRGWVDTMRHGDIAAHCSAVNTWICLRNLTLTQLLKRDSMEEDKENAFRWEIISANLPFVT